MLTRPRAGRKGPGARRLMLLTVVAASVPSILPSHAPRPALRASISARCASQFGHTEGSCRSARATALRLRGGWRREDVPQFRLFKAVENDDVDGIEEAIHRGADVGEANPLGFMAIHMARCSRTPVVAPACTPPRCMQGCRGRTKQPRILCSRFVDSSLPSLSPQHTGLHERGKGTNPPRRQG